MADQSDVEDALVDVVSVALYPNGTAKPAFPGQIAGSIGDGRIPRHWTPI